MTTDALWMTASAASNALDVSRPTLYAYVSRGQIRSERTPGAVRERRYWRQDVERLRRRAEERRDPGQAARGALQWGVPLLESSITLILNNALYYRGLDAIELSRVRSLEEVASLIWTGDFGTTFRSAPVAKAGPRTGVLRRGDDEHLSFISRAQSMLATAGSRDTQAYDLRPEAVARTGWRILTRLTAAASRTRRAADTLEETLAEAWGMRRRDVDLLRSALILCADHELNVSAFTARCVASAGSTPYAVVIGALAAMQGVRHGGASIRTAAMLESLQRERNIRAALADRLRSGERIEGIGHPLYPDGDPRATALLDILVDRYGRSAQCRFIMRTAAAAESVVGERPNIDFALASISRVLQLPSGAPLTIFALGRTIGWIGHAIEQYRTGHVIRPRAKYVGRVPATTEPGTRRETSAP
jgi:citrate synthase